MSAVPYAAASELDLRRFTVQVAFFATPNVNVNQLFVPSGQWWRPLVYQFYLRTGAVVASRVVELQAIFPDRTNAYQIIPPQVQPASLLLVIYNYGPQLQAYSNLTVTNAASQTAPVTDIIFGGGSEFNMTVANFQAGDSIPIPGSLTYEQYVEVSEAERNADITLTPPLLIT